MVHHTTHFYVTDRTQYVAVVKKKNMIFKNYIWGSSGLSFWDTIIYQIHHLKKKFL